MGTDGCLTAAWWSVWGAAIEGWTRPPLKLIHRVTSRRDAGKSMADFSHSDSEDRARIQAILDAAVDAIITIDEHGIVESANPAVERLFGYPPADLIGRNISILMPSPHRERHDEYIARYLRTGEARVIGIGRELEGLRRDGTTFPLELALSEVRGGARRRFTGIIRDITARKQAEEALRESQARIQAILDTAVDAIITIDEHGIVESANPAVERLFGYPPADLIGRNVSILMPSPHRERHDEYIARYLRTGEARVIGIGRELEGLRRDGTTFPLELALSEVRGGAAPELHRHRPRHHVAQAGRGGIAEGRRAEGRVPGKHLARTAYSSERHHRHRPVDDRRRDRAA